MKHTRIIMGMPVILDIPNRESSPELFEEVFSYFESIDERFSPYKASSEITAINQHGLPEVDWSEEMKTVFRLAEETKRLTGGYFDIHTPQGHWDPSGLVKGWAIHNAAKLILSRGVHNFYLEVAGDIQTSGCNALGRPWAIGIQNPFDRREIIKTVYVADRGIATSGSYVRGQHIYDPVGKRRMIDDIVSITVIGPNVYEADRFATAAFAMGGKGIHFLEALDEFEGYVVDRQGIATMTSGFPTFTQQESYA